MTDGEQVAELEVNTDKCTVKEISSPRAGVVYPDYDEVSDW